MVDRRIPSTPGPTETRAPSPFHVPVSQTLSPPCDPSLALLLEDGPGLEKTVSSLVLQSSISRANQDPGPPLPPGLLPVLFSSAQGRDTGRMKQEFSMSWLLFTLTD